MIAPRLLVPVLAVLLAACAPTTATGPAPASAPSPRARRSERRLPTRVDRRPGARRRAARGPRARPGRRRPRRRVRRGGARALPRRGLRLRGAPAARARRPPRQGSLRRDPAQDRGVPGALRRRREAVPRRAPPRRPARSRGVPVRRGRSRHCAHDVPRRARDHDRLAGAFGRSAPHPRHGQGLARAQPEAAPRRARRATLRRRLQPERDAEEDPARRHPRRARDVPGRPRDPRLRARRPALLHALPRGRDPLPHGARDRGGRSARRGEAPQEASWTPPDFSEAFANAEIHVPRPIGAPGVRAAPRPPPHRREPRRRRRSRGARSSPTSRRRGPSPR